jgi:HPt (histidine-containing phosphotransfer) domain-containing protein
MTHSTANILNESTLVQLVSWIGIEETRSIVLGLLSQAKSSAQELQVAIDRRDPATIQQVVHRIKGAYATLGCEALCLALQNVESEPQPWSQNAQRCAETFALMDLSGERLFEFINRK